MVREDRIKSYRFPSFSVTGSVKAALHTTHPINGEILRVVFTNAQSPGSLWIAESGTNIELFRLNAVTSGTVSTQYYPSVVQRATAGTVAVGSPVTNHVIDNNIYLAGSGLTSGTGTTFGPVIVYYR